MPNLHFVDYNRKYTAQETIQEIHMMYEFIWWFSNWATYSGPGVNRNETVLVLFTTKAQNPSIRKTNDSTKYDDTLQETKKTSENSSQMADEHLPNGSKLAIERQLDSM